MAISNGEEQQNQIIGHTDLAHKTLLQSDALYQVHFLQRPQLLLSILI